MKKNLLIVLMVFIMLTLVSCGPNVKVLEKFKEPQIIELPDQKVIFVTTKGDPSKTGMTAIADLIKVYFSLKAKKQMVPPMARWNLEFTSKDDMVGTWALPVPAEVTEIPQVKGVTSKIELGTWKYGTVAQILHIGPYSTEAPTVEKLTKFVKENGYKIDGLHEEVYIKGPGMFGPGNPEKYFTLIRYNVKKAK